MHHDNEKKKESKYVNAANLFTQFHYLTLISPLASEERFLEDGDFPVIAFFAFTSDCLTISTLKLQTPKTEKSLPPITKKPR